MFKRPISPQLRLALLLTPALAVIGVLYSGGLLLLLTQSLGFFPPTGETSFTLGHYRELLFDREVRAAFWLTLKLATVATAASAVAGLGLALALREAARHSVWLNVLLQIPLALPHLALAVVLINLIAPSGLLARLAYAAGWLNAPADFPVLIGDRYGLGILVAYVLKETPFILLMTLAVLVKHGDEYEQVARTLGASAWQRLRYVTLPLVAPTVVSAALIVFAFVFGAFEVPFVLGRPYPAALAVVAQRRFSSTDLTERPSAIALTMLITLSAVALVWLYARLARAIVGVARPTLF